jgi:hypothetical protein
MFKAITQKIAEWITGLKRRSDTHPLDYVNHRQERIEQSKDEVKATTVVINPPQPQIIVPIVPEPVKEPEIVKAPEPVKEPEPVKPLDPNAAWPFPVSPPEKSSAVIKTQPLRVNTPEKKPRKPRTKKPV